MSTETQPIVEQEKVVEEKKILVVEPPAPQTVVVTTRPPLIPDENATAYCLTRRNIFDAIIALLLAGGIIYLVMSWRSARPYTGLTRTMRATTTTAAAARPTGFGADIAKLTGGMKKIMKKLFG